MTSNYHNSKNEQAYLYVLQQALSPASEKGARTGTGPPINFDTQ